MNIENIVVKVFSSMGGEAHSEDLLFAEVLKQHKELVDNQADVRKAIASLLQKGVIVHDSKMPLWIHLNK